MNSIAAARLFAFLTTCTALFQAALAGGVPWGSLAWGGRYRGTLPSNMRIASGASVLVLLALGLIVLIRAGLITVAWKLPADKLVWVVVAYCVLGVIANAITPSNRERIIWLPVTVLLLVSSIVVAAGP